MDAVREIVVLIFASVGFIALGQWIYRNGWSTLWKVAGIGAIVLLFWAMANGPFRGIWFSDHGPLIDLIATAGIVLATRWAVTHRRFARDWRPRAALVAGSFALIFVLWVPRYLAGELNVHGMTSQSTAQAPASQISYIQSAGASAPNQNSGNNGHSHKLRCSELSFEARQVAGCP